MFQYASLRNLDQLATRIECHEYIGFHVGRTGVLASGIRASVGVLLALRLLQSTHANTQLSHVEVPPRERGCT